MRLHFQVVWKSGLQLIKDKQLISYAMSKSKIGEPFLLATYTSTIRGNNLLRKPGVYATVSQKSSSDDHVTVAVQADGVHVLDVSCFFKKNPCCPKLCFISHK